MQAIASSRSSTMAELLKPIMKAFDNVLERRLLPIRSISAQVLCRADAGCMLSKPVDCLWRLIINLRNMGVIPAYLKVQHSAWLCRQIMRTV